jgi:hypothetical protein
MRLVFLVDFHGPRDLVPLTQPSCRTRAFSCSEDARGCVRSSAPFGISHFQTTVFVFAFASWRCPLSVAEERKGKRGKEVREKEDGTRVGGAVE